MNDTSGVPGWVVFMVRGLIAAALALTLTFLPDHSSTVGFLSVGLFCILTGAAIGLGALRSRPLDRVSANSRTAVLVSGVLVVGGITHLVLSASSVTVLLFAATVVFAVSGVLEVVSGIRSRDRDYIFLGATSALLAIAAVAIPADYVLTYTVNEESRTMTASVIFVGALGIYAAIVAVYLVIAALSLKWAQGTPPPPSGSTK